MTRWLITVNATSKSRFYFDVNVKVSRIRAEFLGAGFTVTDYVGLYYTPLNRQRFYVQHAKASAITAFLLGFNNSNCSLTVGQLD
jgi:hypothetical protein